MQLFKIQYSGSHGEKQRGKEAKRQGKSPPSPPFSKGGVGGFASLLLCFFASLLLFFYTMICTSLAQPGGIDTGSVNSITPTTTMGLQAETHFDIEFRQAPLRDALQFLSWIGSTNVIIPEGITGTVTVSFRDISIRDAITSIVKSRNMDFTIEGGIVRIGSKDAFQESGEDLRTETFRLRYAVAKDMRDKIQKILSTRGSLVDDERTNSLIVRELPSNLGNVRRLIEDVDIRDAQVLIEAKILEATRNFSRSLGIQWGVNMSGNTFNVTGVNAVGKSDASRSLNTNLPATNPTSGIGLLIGQLAGGTNIDMQISAAEQRGDIYIISDPSIVTSNGKAAHIRSGSTLLIKTTGDVNIGTPGGTQTTAGTGLQEIKTGVELNVTPHISVEDYVKLDIEAITSQPDFTRAIDGVPIVVDNTARTTVLIRDGETTVIGGLSRFSDALTKKRVPFFSRIPVLGNLFKSKDRVKENSELMIFIKPTIVRGDSTLPAQSRVHEVEQRRDEMTLTPILKTTEKKGEVPLEKPSDEPAQSAKKRGHKYVRD